MIDCGHNATTGFRPGNHLAGLGTRFLDQLVVTNLDEDHVSGFPSFADNKVTINWMLFNPSVSAANIKDLKSETGMGKGMNALVASQAARVPVVPALLDNNPADALPGVGLRWYWNPYPYFDDENNLSVVLLVMFKGFWFLFPGDMEKAGFKNLLETNESFRQIVPLVDVLMASHHGRESGLYRPLFEQYGCNPKLTVISDDYMQHGSQETTNYYGSKTKGLAWRTSSGLLTTRKVLTTRSDGEIRFSFRDNDCWTTCTKG